MSDIKDYVKVKFGVELDCIDGIGWADAKGILAEPIQSESGRTAVRFLDSILSLGTPPSEDDDYFWECVLCIIERVAFGNMGRVAEPDSACDHSLVP